MRRSQSGPGIIQRGTTFELGFRLRSQTLFAIDRSKHAVKTGNLRRQAYRPLKFGLGKHELIQSCIRFPQEFMCFRVFRGDLDRLLEVRHRFIATILIEEQISQARRLWLGHFPARPSRFCTPRLHPQFDRARRRQGPGFLRPSHFWHCVSDTVQMR